MWWAGSSAVLDVYVGTHAVAACEGGACLLSQVVHGADAAIETVSAWLDQDRRRCSIRVWLSGALAEPLLVQPLPAVSTKEFRRVVCALVEHRYGEGWEARETWIAPGRSASPRVVVSLPRSLLTRLRAALGMGMRRRVVAISPWWSSVLRFALRRHPEPLAIGIQDCSSLIVLMGREGTFDMVAAHSPLMNQESADAAWLRALLNGDIAADGELRCRLMLDGSGDRTPDPHLALGAMTMVSK